MSRSAKRIFVLACLLLCFSAGGCRSTKFTAVDAHRAYLAGDFETATEVLQELSEDSRRSHHASQLDLAMVEIASGRPAAAESRLRGLRDHFDALPEAAALQDAASLATDDNARPFRLAGYEEVLLRSLLTVCSLTGDGTDAEAYCLQAERRQQELERESGEDSEESGPSQQVAFVPYLRGALREATHTDYDDAERAFRLVSQIVPEFAPAPADIRRASEGVHSRSGHGVVYVIAMVGRGPRLVETVAPTTTTSLQLASMLLRAGVNAEEGRNNDPVLPNIASVKVPVVEIPPSNIAAVGVISDGKLLGATQTLTDVGQLAIDRSESDMSWTIARAVARRVVKESSVAATSRSLGLAGDAAAAFEFAAMTAWSASEHADIRCWGLLPREIQVMRLELPEGQQEIELAPMAGDGHVYSSPRSLPLRVEDGRNHYVVVAAPDDILSIVPNDID